MWFLYEVNACYALLKDQSYSRKNRRLKHQNSDFMTLTNLECNDIIQFMSIDGLKGLRVCPYIFLYVIDAGR